MEIRDFMLIATKLKKEMAAHKASMKKTLDEVLDGESVLEGTKQKHNLVALEAKLLKVISDGSVGDQGAQGATGARTRW